MEVPVRRCPRPFGCHASVRTTILVRHYIDTWFGIESGQERARQLLDVLGFRLVSPASSTPEGQG